MRITIKITTKDFFPGATKTEINQVLTSVYSAGLEHYHANYVDLHFRNLATRRYGYRPRQGEPGGANPPGSKYFKRSYTWRKLREKKHTRPLEWSGVTRQQAALRDVRANSKGSKLIYNVQILNYKPWLFDELTRVTPAEWDTVTQAMQARLDFHVSYFRSFKQETLNPV